MLLLSFGTRELVSDKKDFSCGILRQIEVSSAGLACQRGLHYCWQVSLHQMPVSEVLLLLPLTNTYTLRCCSKCASTCLQCPLKLKLGADQVVAAILGLGDESFKLDLIQLFTLNS